MTDRPTSTNAPEEATRRPAILDIPAAATETDSARRAARRMLQRADEEES